MATVTEILRAAEHMHKRCLDEVRGDQVLRIAFHDASEMLKSEAKRLQAIDAQQPKRVPFAVLRRAYYELGLFHSPSTRWLERHGAACDRYHSARIRIQWRAALGIPPADGPQPA